VCGAMAAHRTPSRGRLTRSLAVALVPAAMALAGGCSLANDAVSGITAPLGALPATDVVVETNLETDLTLLGSGGGLGGAGGGLGVTGLGGAGGGAAGSGAPDGFVSGASTGPSVTSYAAPQPGVVVIVAWNDLTHDCLGIARLGGTAAVLGESTVGTYDFVARRTPQGGCVASSFADSPAKPASWPAGDPSNDGFPAA
jgi:hypothetical protein